MSKINLAEPVAKFVKNIEEAGGKPLYELTPKEARQVLRDVQKDEENMPEAQIEEIDVPLKTVGKCVCCWLSLPMLTKPCLLSFIFTAAAGLWGMK